MEDLSLIFVIALWGWLLIAGLDAMLTEWEKRKSERSEVGMNQIVLPWPDKALSPNSRTHWATKARAVKLARIYGHGITLAAGLNTGTFKGYEGKLHLWIDYYAKTRNYPDADNCLSASKAYLDGISDALGVNDRRFVYHPLVKDETGGKVVIRITKEAAC